MAIGAIFVLCNYLANSMIFSLKRLTTFTESRLRKCVINEALNGGFVRKLLNPRKYQIRILAHRFDDSAIAQTEDFLDQQCSVRNATQFPGILPPARFFQHSTEEIYTRKA